MYIEYLGRTKDIDAEQRCIAEQKRITERNKLILEYGFFEVKLWGVDHIFEIYDMGMIAHICDQTDRWVGDITRPLSVLERDKFEYNMRKYPEDFLHSRICISGTIPERLKWIKDQIQKTTWMR